MTYNFTIAEKKMGRRSAAKRKRRAERNQYTQSTFDPDSPTTEELINRYHQAVAEYTASGGQIIISQMPTEELRRQRTNPTQNEEIPTVYLQTRPDYPGQQLPIVTYSSHFQHPTTSDASTQTE